MKNKVTVLQLKTNMKKEFKKGDVVEFKKEPNNEHDADAIMVIYNGKHIGYIGNNEEKGTVLNGTLSASKVKEKNPISGKIISLEAETGYLRKYVAEVTSEKKEVPNELEFSLIGGISTFPAKMDLLKEIEKGERTVVIKKEDENLLGYYEGKPVGKVKAEEEVLRRLTDFLEDSKELKATTKSKSRGNLLCSLKMKKARKKTKKRNLEKIMEKIVKDGIDSKENMDEKLKYMVENKVHKNNISDVFLSYVDYGENKSRIKKPKTLYIDSNGIVNDSIIYILGKQNLIYEGDKGVGKNVLTETMAWLFNRPLYEFSSNSQHSNNSLMGGETFKKPEKNEEDDKNVVSFIKTAVNKFFKKTDDRELDAISNFVKNAIGKDDKELVFQMSSILEAFVNGGIIVLDEFNTSQAHVMPLFNALLDERRRVEVTGLGKVDAHPNFVAIGTQNKGYQGTFDSNEATLDRFEPIIFPSLESISKLLEEKNPDIGYETINICNKLYAGIKKGVETGTLGEDAISTRGFISATKAISRGMSVKRALINSVANRAGDLDDREAIKNMIDLQIGE